MYSITLQSPVDSLIEKELIICCALLLNQSFSVIRAISICCPEQNHSAVRSRESLIQTHPWAPVHAHVGITEKSFSKSIKLLQVGISQHFL